MTILTKETELKRAQFTQEILDSIRNAPAYCSFYSHVFSRLAALGLQRKAKKEGLFGNEDWSNLTLVMIVVMYIAYLNKDDFFKMFQRIDHEETGSEFLRLLRGEFYWYEVYILDLCYVFVFYTSLVNLIVVLYPVKPPYNSIKIMVRYQI